MNKVEKILKTGINKESLRAYADKSDIIRDMAETIANKYHYELIHDPAFITDQKLVAKLNFYGYQYIHELNDDILKYQRSCLAIGEQLCQKIDYDMIHMSAYSPLLWFTFIPVLKNMVAGKEDSLDDVKDDAILEAFEKNNLFTDIETRRMDHVY